MNSFINISLIIAFFVIVIVFIYYFNNIKHTVKCKGKLNNEFHNIYANNIFNIHKTNPNKNVLIFNNNTYIGFVACFHHSNTQQDINELRNTYKNIYIIIIDGEPTNLTNTTPDMIISTKHEQQYSPP